MLDQKENIYRYIGRSGCSACDRNEALYQFRRLNTKIAHESALLTPIS